MAMDFKLSDDFVDSYKDKEVPWGYQDGAGNALGEITALRTYSRKKEDGTKERWHEICRRVIEGMFTVQKRHCRNNRIEWKNDKAQRTAKDAYDRMFNMKWLPPGRGLWAMGSPIVMEDNNSAPLMNCAFVSTNESVVEAAEFLFDASMLGVGVGFDSDGADKFNVRLPEGEAEHVVADSREGWVASLKALMLAYIDEGQRATPLPVFNYSEIRPAGSPIKRFGGTASGPDPLKKLHQDVHKILKSRVGQKVSMRDINDIHNMIGTCVIAGNVRRSAEISFIDSDSPHLEEFTELKNYEKNPDRANHGFMANNSIRVKVGDDYSRYMDGIKLNGEPGLVWMDVIRQYGRLKDPIDNKDHRAKGLNPCATYDTQLLTKEYGLVPIGHVAETGAHFTVWNGNKWSPSKAWYTGDKQVFKITLTSGLEIKLTDNHIVEVWRDGDERGRNYKPFEVEVRDIQPGDKMMPLLGDGSWDGQVTDVDEMTATLYGLLLGDGTRQVNGGSSAMMTNYEPEVLEFLRGYGSVGKHEVRIIEPKEQGSTNIRVVGVLEDMASVGIVLDPLPERAISEDSPIFGWAPNLVRAFLKGLFSANGGSMSRHNRVDLKTSCKTLAQQVQRLLLALGMSAYITTNKPAEIDWDNGTYTSKESYDVNVGSMYGYCKFHKEIGFLHDHKTDLAAISREVSPRRPQLTTIRSIEPVGEQPVYDFHEPDIHWGWANGFKIHNCSEQPLESHEACCLVEVFIGNCEDQDDFIKTLKVAYLYGKTVTLMQTKWEKTNTVQLRNRRIGLGVSGVANYVDTHGLPDLRSTLDDGYGYLLKLDNKYSSWLCVRDSIKHSTVKPSGSVSIVAGASPGVHWTPGGEYFIRRITFAKTDPLFQALKSAGYEHSDLDWDPNSAVILFPIHSGSKRSASEVPVWEKINLAAEMQYWWSDNAVSCTVDFKQEEADQIPTLLSMYEGKLKGISFLPSIDGGAYKNMPYEQITKEQYEEMRKNLKRVDFSESYGESALEATSEEFCTSDVCAVTTETTSMNGDLETPHVSLPSLKL